MPLTRGSRVSKVGYDVMQHTLGTDSSMFYSQKAFPPMQPPSLSYSFFYSFFSSAWMQRMLQSVGLLLVGLIGGIVLSDGTRAQIPQTSISQPCTACSPQSIYAVEIDGDSDKDILFASHDDNKIAWYENTGSGSFSSQKIISTSADGAQSVYAVDLDGDTDTDVLSASMDDDKIMWYENDGSGNFSSGKTITTSAAAPQSVYAADMDGDTDKDVLFASFIEDKIAWYENDGSGNFSSQKTITTNADAAFSVYAADVDNDGDKDVLSASRNDDKIAWYENLDNGGVSTTQNVITTNADGARSVYAADLDGDNDKDILSASQNDDKIAWYENLDSGGVSTTQNVITTNASSAESVYAADLDGDGDKDVLSASFSTIAWYENSGSGSFSSRKTITYSVSGAQSVYAADLDGDTEKDVLSVSEYDDKIAWYENRIDEGQGFPNSTAINPLPNANEPTSVYAVDVDNDGDKDVLSASARDDKIAWYENRDSDGVSRIQNVITTNADRAYSVYAADVDNDGDKDILSASVFDDKIAWYENKDLGGVSTTQNVITTNASVAFSVYAADVDNDGDKDILSASSRDNKIAWYENLDDGGVSTTQKVITTSADGARSVYAADVDGDGDKDILSASLDNSASSDNDKISWYENLDSGAISTTQNVITTSADGALSVYAADLDGDNDKDVLSASSTDDKIAWYENTSGVLPVEFASFDAQQHSDAVVLTWRTASEQNNAGFEVQRRVSSGWEPISFVEGAGTTSEAQTYRYRDTDLPYEADSVTYRLKQVDTDGATSFSGTRTLKIGAPERIALHAPFPNPARGQVTIRYALPRKEDVSIRVYDVLGRQVATLQRGTEDVGRKEVQVSTSDLSSGTYFVRMQAGEKLKMKRLTVVK